MSVQEQVVVRVDGEEFRIPKDRMKTIMRDSLLEGFVASAMIEGETFGGEQINALYAVHPPEEIPDELLRTK